MYAKIGDTIQWTFPKTGMYPVKLLGKTFKAEVSMVDYKEKHYGVYVDYCGGQDKIPFENAALILTQSPPNH